MTDFRKIEADLIDFFEAAGVDVRRYDGDAYAVVASVTGCEIPRACEATFVGGKIVCTCAVQVGPNPVDEATSLSLTKLAERLSTR
ncbi:hypothetical protein [Bradyrhizobium sp. USDA 4350]